MIFCNFIQQRQAKRDGSSSPNCFKPQAVVCNTLNMKTLLTLITLILIACNSSTENTELNAKIRHQQAIIDSLTKVQKAAVPQNQLDSIQNPAVQNKSNTDKTSAGFDLERLPEVGKNGEILCPIKIISSSTNYNNDFSATGTLEFQNNYPDPTSAIELDFGASKKRIRCKIPAKGNLKKTLTLTEEEAKNFMTFYKDGANYGLRISKVIFNNGSIWEK